MKKITLSTWATIAMLIILIGIFASCATLHHKSKKHLEKALNEDKAFVIDTLRKIVPCIVKSADTLFAHDTTTLSKTDTITKDIIKEIKCPDGSKVLDTCHDHFYTTKTDTTINSYYQVTIRIKDVADSLTEAHRANINATEAKKQSGKKEFWMYWAIITTILSLLLIIVIVIKSKTKIIEKVTS